MQAEIEKLLPEVMDALEQLHRQSWEVALQARQFQDRLHEASQSLHYLQGRGLQGEDFQAAIDREASLQSALASIPEPFLTALQEEILAQPDRMSVTSVHQLLNDQQPVVDGLLSQVNTWIGQYQEASTNLSDLQKIASAARQQLASMPQDLLLAEPDSRLKKLAATINNLNDRLAHPQAGQLTGCASEARLAGKAAQDLSQQLERARQHQGELVKVINDLAVNLELLVRQMGDLATRHLPAGVGSE